MTADDFIKMNRGINDDKDLPVAFLMEIYNSIARDEIKMSSDLADMSSIGHDEPRWSAPSPLVPWPLALLAPSLHLALQCRVLWRPRLAAVAGARSRPPHALPCRTDGGFLGDW